ncbi:hypothetical protein MUY40_28105 [Blautia sp. NSJ-159]|uniref:hypothetical protein n=1 Tax=unclassified Blautia TaxID=2648079 RepID=UPI000CDB8282|nr:MULTISPECIES: hypothetical protein [unclassified Blautia]MCJ8020805.1 hypothetical protein [Blautia sp. NSJ-159]MCJ8043713.1 hypothetical protein [Blautia sp. NSJ-165]POP37527.1 hypothetical protein C3R19_14410 [Blautia producta]
MIDEGLIPKIENIFGFPLYDLQKSHLLGKPHDYFYDDRCNGKTFAYCLKILLSDEKSIPRKPNAFMRLSDSTFYSARYNKWFAGYLYEINKKLESAGIHTRVEK